MLDPDKIIPEPGTPLEKMFNRKPGIMGKDYHDAMNQQFAKQLYGHYDESTVQKIVNWFNERDDMRAAKKILQERNGRS